MATKTLATKSMQLWPRGKSFQVRGEYREEMRVKGDKDKRWRKPTEEEYKDIRIEEYAERIRDREVYCLDSCLVSDLMKAGNSGDLGSELNDEFSYENVKNLRPDSEGWDLEKCKEWIEDHGMDLPDPNPWGMDREELVKALHGDEVWAEIEKWEDWDEDEQGPRPELGDPTGIIQDASEEVMRETLIEKIDDEEIDGIEDYRDMVRDNNEDAEIYEWYRVSKWLAEKLEEVGECVLNNAYGEWWGRQATGQNNIMDGTFQSVAKLQLDKYGYH